jgi:hypothetical protein
MRRLLLLPLAALVLAPAASAGTTQPCLLITSEDAAKFLGGKVAAGKASKLGLYKACTYTLGKKKLAVYSRQVSKAGFEKEAKKNPPPVFPIPAIGDGAFSVAAGGALIVWQKGTELTFAFEKFNPVVQTQKDIAKTALKRL